MTESLRQLVERLVYGSGYAETFSNAAFFQRHGLPRPGYTFEITRAGWWCSWTQTGFLPESGRGPEICCYGACRAAAHLVLAVEALGAEGREVPAELSAAAALLLAENAASVGRAP